MLPVIELFYSKVSQSLLFKSLNLNSNGTMTETHILGKGNQHIAIIPQQSCLPWRTQSTHPGAGAWEKCASGLDFSCRSSTQVSAFARLKEVCRTMVTHGTTMRTDQSLLLAKLNHCPPFSDIWAQWFVSWFTQMCGRPTVCLKPFSISPCPHEALELEISWWSYSEMCSQLIPYHSGGPSLSESPSRLTIPR